MSDFNDNGLTIGPTLETLDDGVTADFVEITSADTQQEETPADLIGGKFKSQDDLLKAYQELEKKLGAPKEEAPVEEAKDEPKTKMGEEAEEGDQTLEDTPSSETSELDVVKFANEFFEKGELSEESYQELADNHKLPKDVVDTFMAGVQAMQSQRMSEIHKAAGGEEAYADMIKWGTDNLPQAEIDAFNAAIDQAVVQGEYTNLNMLVKGIRAQMSGDEPRYVESRNSNTASNGTQPFANRSEMVKAMSDPRYSRDPRYVQEVMARLAASDF